MSGYLGFQVKELEYKNLLEEVTELRNEVEVLKTQVTELLSDRDNGEEEK